VKKKIFLVVINLVIIGIGFQNCAEVDSKALSTNDEILVNLDNAANDRFKITEAQCVDEHCSFSLEEQHTAGITGIHQKKKRGGGGTSVEYDFQPNRNAKQETIRCVFSERNQFDEVVVICPCEVEESTGFVFRF
jgi:hypothetical protein